MTALGLWIPGVPVPQGSKSVSAFMAGGAPRASMFDQNATKLRPWRRTVKERAQLAASRHEPYDDAVRVRLVFCMPMPKSRPAADRRAGWRWHTVKPDIDKLTRAVLDGLTDGGIIADDARICQLTADTIETTSGTGCAIALSRPAEHPPSWFVNLPRK